MPKIRYIPFGGCTGLEIRDEDGAHLCNILPPQYMMNKNYLHVDNYCCTACDFTYEELLDTIHKLREGKL